MTREQAMIEMVKGHTITHPKYNGIFKLKNANFVFMSNVKWESIAIMNFDNGYEIYKEKKVRKLWFWRVKTFAGQWYMPDVMFDDNGVNGEGSSPKWHDGWNSSKWHELEKQRLDILGCVEVEE